MQILTHPAATSGEAKVFPRNSYVLGGRERSQRLPPNEGHWKFMSFSLEKRSPAKTRAYEMLPS